MPKALSNWSYFKDNLICFSKENSLNSHKIELFSCLPLSSFFVVEIKNILLEALFKNFLTETSDVSVVNSYTHFPSYAIFM